jgi:membrane glycosyltransferase
MPFKFNSYIMLKLHIILFWVSGLAFGLMVCAYFSCPHWKLAMPVMLLISVVVGRIGFNKKKELENL